MVAVRLENVVCRHTLKRGETHPRVRPAATGARSAAAPGPRARVPRRWLRYGVGAVPACGSAVVADRRDKNLFAAR